MNRRQSLLSVALLVAVAVASPAQASTVWVWKNVRVTEIMYNGVVTFSEDGTPPAACAGRKYGTHYALHPEVDTKIALALLESAYLSGRSLQIHIFDNDGTGLASDGGAMCRVNLLRLLP